MVVALPSHPRSRHRPLFSRRVARPRLETLEGRALPAVTSWPGLFNPVIEAEANDTLDLGHDLGNLSVAALGEAVGTIGDATTPADVDWYSFTLDRPAHVTLRTLNQAGNSPLESFLSLFNSDPDNFADFSNPLFHRLLARDDGAARGGDAQLERDLPAGTFHVAVSGSGNSAFHPFLADSGSAGSTGDYGLQVTAADLPLDPTAGPVVLLSEPAAGATLDRAPFLLRLTVSAELDAATVLADQTVQLFHHPDGTFGDGGESLVPLLLANFSAAASEVQVQPATALRPGYYQLFLAGDSGAWPAVVTDVSGVPLGQDAAHASGQDFVVTFQVTGREALPAGPGDPEADDTAAAAHDLGTLSGEAFVQRDGAIGDDPAYDGANADPLLTNPAADVDLYRFTVADAGPVALLVEVFAGRIGSPLDPGVSLFRVNPLDGSLELLAVNDSTLNESAATNGLVPLYTDAVLYAGLSAGEYVLAVSGTTNLPDPAGGTLPGTNGVFDPAVSHSGSNGFLLGDYRLSLRLHPDNFAPEVVAATPAESAILDAAPARLLIQFSEPVNLQQMDYQVNQATGGHELAVVFVRGSDGVDYHPRLLRYDPATNEAEFLMLDALPNGAAELHLSGPLGLTDFAGNPLPGNDPSGDHVVRFTVNGPARGTAGNPLLWTDQEPNNTLATAQLLGVLFPHELQASVRFVRDFTAAPASAPADTADYYQFEVLQERTYHFRLTGSGLPAGAAPTLMRTDGTVIPLLSQAGGAIRSATLAPGVYVVRVGGWTVAQAANVTYQLRLALAASSENPTPLTVGPAPAYRIRLVNPTPPPPPPTTGTTDPTPPPPTTGTTDPTPPPPPSGDPTHPPPPLSPPPVDAGSPPAPVGDPQPVSSPIVDSPTPTNGPPSPTVPPPTPVPTNTPTPTDSSVTPGDTTSPSSPPTSPLAGTTTTAPTPPAAVVPPPRLELTLPVNPPPAITSPPAPPAGGIALDPTIPSALLAALSGAPVGGVPGGFPSNLNPAGERLTFQPPAGSPLEGMLRLVLLTQPESGGTSVLPGGESVPPPQDAGMPPVPNTSVPLSPAVQQFLQQFGPLWEAAVDSLFRDGAPEPDENMPPLSPVTPPLVEPVERDCLSGENAQSRSGTLSPAAAWLGLALGVAMPAVTDGKRRDEESER